ncbi:MAG: efflux RND transporter periplasmic adaptor subunit [Odoribacter sp.]|nr:efflux RND transporter periplasmic adaptor subunit [Odoribacter sp.]
MYRIAGYIILILLPLVSCRKKEADASISTPPRPVKVIKAEALGNINRRYTGIVQATEFSVLAFKLPGTLKEMNVQTGQKVRKGQVIARIKPFDYRLQYETAQANYRTAQSIYERNKNLLAANATAVQNLEIAEADYVQAASALQISHRTLEYTTLKAPFNGFVEEKYVDNFEEVQAGQAIVRLVNPQDIEVHFILPETGILLLHIPHKIFVEFDSQKGKLFSADIKEQIYASNGSGIPIIVKITDEQFAPYRKNVFPGFSCKVTWEIDNTIADKFIIPATALQTNNGKEYVWMVDAGNSVARRQEIQTSRLDGHIVVESGLESHDLIVTAGLSSLREGQIVSTIQKQ